MLANTITQLVTDGFELLIQKDAFKTNFRIRLRKNEQKVDAVAKKDLTDEELCRLILKMKVEMDGVQLTKYWNS